MMTDTARRIVIYLFVILMCLSVVLAKVNSALFDIVLNFVLRYNLEFILPIWLHAYGLLIAFNRRSEKLGTAMLLIFCITSIGSFFRLDQNFTFSTYCFVAAVPCIYVIAGDLISEKSKLRGLT